MNYLSKKKYADLYLFKDLSMDLWIYFFVYLKIYRLSLLLQASSFTSFSLVFFVCVFCKINKWIVDLK